MNLADGIDALFDNNYGEVNLLTGVLGSTGGAFGFENVIGTESNNSIIGTTCDNTIDGAGGDDTIIALEGNDRIYGGGGDNSILGCGENDLIFLQDGDADHVNAGSGNDGIFFGAAFTAADTVDGGAGTGDQLALQGDYSAGTMFGAQGADGIELVVLLSGGNTLFGAPGTDLYEHDLTLVDANIGAGEELAFQANQLQVGEDLTLDASAETDDTIFTFAGLGGETIRVVRTMTASSLGQTGSIQPTGWTERQACSTPWACKGTIPQASL